MWYFVTAAQTDQDFSEGNEQMVWYIAVVNKCRSALSCVTELPQVCGLALCS